MKLNYILVSKTKYPVEIIHDDEKLKKVIQENNIHLYRKLDSFQRGSKVKIINERGILWNVEGLMDKFIGATLTIHSVQGAVVTFKEEDAKKLAFFNKRH